MCHSLWSRAVLNMRCPEGPDFLVLLADLQGHLVGQTSASFTVILRLMVCSCTMSGTFRRFRTIFSGVRQCSIEKGVMAAKLVLGNDLPAAQYAGESLASLRNAIDKEGHWNFRDISGSLSLPRRKPHVRALPGIHVLVRRVGLQKPDDNWNVLDLV